VTGGDVGRDTQGVADGGARDYRGPSRPWALAALAVVAVALGAALGGSGKARIPPTTKPSVLLITVDTQRPDRLGCYGHPVNSTPAVDRLAREGTLFDHAYCDIPWTTGSMASVMTGTYSNRHGLQLPMHRLKDESLTLAEVLSAAGYQTAAVIGSFPLDSVYGLDQGFDVYDDEFSLPILTIPGKKIRHVESDLSGNPWMQREVLAEKLTSDAYRPDEDVTSAALRWFTLVRDRDRPFFLWVHYFGPHERTDLSRGITEQEPDVVAAYDGEVEATDRAVKRLVDYLRRAGVLDSTLVVYHADHGQSLGENGVVGHGSVLYDAVTRIPLIFRYPSRFPAGVRRTDLARNVDIWPTVLDVLGVTGHTTGTGRSLAPAAAAGETSGDEPVAYLETYTTSISPRLLEIPGLGTVLGPIVRHGLRTHQWTLIVSRVVGRCAYGPRGGRNRDGSYYLEAPVDLDLSRCRSLKTVELYSAQRPEQRRFNVASEHPEVVAALRAALETMRTDHPANAAFELSPEEEAKLRSLGYLR
jgi:arylsulfatase A-like enzyme